MNNRVNGILGMSRAFGDFTFKTGSNNEYLGNQGSILSVPDIYTQKLKSSNNYHILLASDGLWNGCTMPDIQNSLKTFQCKQKYNIQELTTKALRKSKDNLTLIYIPINTKNYYI